MTKVCSLCLLILTHSYSTYTLCSALVLTPNRRGKRCVTGLAVAAEKSSKDSQECNSIATKYHRLVFFSPSLSVSIYPSAALMRFHENSEAEQVGVVAPGVGTTKLNRMRMQYWKISIICASAAEALLGSSRQDFICAHVWPHRYKKISTTDNPCPHQRCNDY